VLPSKEMRILQTCLKVSTVRSEFFRKSSSNLH